MLNVIANSNFTLLGDTVDASVVTPALLANTLQEADGVEANVATGYHAIEFLLWGQDLNGHWWRPSGHLLRLKAPTASTTQTPSSIKVTKSRWRAV